VRPELYALAYIAPLTVYLGALWGGWGTLLTASIVFLVHPILDRAAVERASLESLASPSPEDPRYLALVRFYPVVQAALLLFLLSRIPQMTGVDFCGCLFSMGLCSGIVGITAAHELIHRPTKVDRALGVALLSMVSYAHFRIEHVLGHHPFVATPRDPASARRGETVYGFWMRSIVGSTVSAWRIEKDRLARLRLGASSWENRMWHYLAIQSLLYASVGVLFGGWGVLFFAGQGVLAILLLETINYIEHYGLERARRPDGSYEPVSPAHSWDSPYRLSSLFLFNLNYHSHHHAVPSRSFDGLRPLDAAPELPFGYSRMVLAALVPPLWRRLIHPRLPA